MAIINCVDTESEAHDWANAAFEEAASQQLEELGYSHEIIALTGFSFHANLSWESIVLPPGSQLPLFSG